LLGEAAAIVLVLLPALCLGEWTRSDTHLRLRAAMQAATAGLVFLYLVPEIAFALRPGQGWTPMHKLAGGRLAFEAVLLLAVPGLSAVQEFAVRGGGTPIPYDPPRRLVTSGVYRYLANPMQLSCSCVLLAWAALLQDSWLLVPAAFAVVYSAGIARWDERQDLRDRFGADWIAYRAEVADWRPRWRPFHAGRPARVYIARGCEPCSRVRRWLERRHPTGLEIVEAETLPAGSIRRMRYDPADGSAPVEGIRAMARAMEHLHLGWAFCGALARLPGIWQMLQLVLDAGGLGPREISCTSGPGAGAPTRPRRAEESS
jgi:protein-S-isoprenylcysteine O-methyltransferase Ste14